MSTPSRIVPGVVAAGDSIEFLIAIPTDYLTWAGSARLTGVGQMASTSCATEGADFHVKFQGKASGGATVDGTSALAAGQYTLTVWATNGNDRVTVGQFPLSLTPDLSTGTPALAHAIQILSTIETAIRARISGNGDGGIEEYSIDGTQVRKLPLLELEKLRNKYAAEVAALQNASSPIRRVNFVMAPAGGSTAMPFGFRGRLW